MKRAFAFVVAGMMLVAMAALLAETAIIDCSNGDDM
ncbi:MAG: hypothetical protein AVDCRST_MAG28-1159 [uncultured Rubrobacteraceae bacterium]|uniref:Uncharacterized protein n=1 Tax=uncultured Rubrobacteraceae bacterium TaxID=349277 RepID=A0A6J4QM36_9ACTN|nr:MAG: hypothetical protein AVDCRST_MAG28-1159 [uncultured Rubrobacteraceae bacterium]